MYTFMTPSLKINMFSLCVIFLKPFIAQNMTEINMSL